MKTKHCVVTVFLAVSLLAVSAFSATPSTFNPAARLRRPVALRLTPDERTALVANRRAGTLSILDIEKKATIAEVELGKELSDLTVTADQQLYLATDEAAHELILFHADPNQDKLALKVRQRLPVSPYPVSVVASRDGLRCYVASLWSRRLTVVDLPKLPTGVAKIAKTIDLEIAPRQQLLVRDDSRLIVADSFGGKLAVIDTQAVKLLGVREFPGHNIRGLGLSSNGKMLVVAHQMLNDYAHTTRNDVHWGLLMSNDLRWLKLDRVLSGDGDLFDGGHMHPLGHAGNATGDPAGLTVLPDGTVVVTLGGVGEIAQGKESDFSLQRMKVGTRPTTIVASRDGRRVFIANTFGDSITIADLVEQETLAEVSLGPSGKLTAADQGELLFYDARLSHDRWMSCQSCHSDGHTNGQLNDNFSDASFGAAKRVLSLLGRADTAPFAWNGSSKDLATQVRKSIDATMQGDKELTDEQVGSLVAYMESLKSPPSVDALRGTANKAAIERGRELFAEQKCTTCHAPPTYTTPQTYDVGLVDKQGNRKFNPPSLRGVGQRAPYFHDNRAATLEDLLRNHDHPVERALSDEELEDMIAFLRSL